MDKNHAIRMGETLGEELFPRVAVFVAQKDGELPIDFYFSSDWIILPPPGMNIDMNLVRSTSYKLSFQVRKLHLMVAFLGLDSLSLRPVENLHHLLWDGSIAIWPGSFPEVVGGLEMHNLWSDEKTPRFHQQFHRYLAGSWVE